MPNNIYDIINYNDNYNYKIYLMNERREDNGGLLADINSLQADKNAT